MAEVDGEMGEVHEGRGEMLVGQREGGLEVRAFVIIFVVAGNLRLVDNSSSGLSSSGRLEIFFSQEWGTICDTLFAEAAADIACRQLGFSGVSNYGTVDSLG